MRSNRTYNQHHVDTPLRSNIANTRPEVAFSACNEKLQKTNGYATNLLDVTMQIELTYIEEIPDELKQCMRQEIETARVYRKRQFVEMNTNMKKMPWAK